LLHRSDLRSRGAIRLRSKNERDAIEIGTVRSVDLPNQSGVPLPPDTRADGRETATLQTVRAKGLVAARRASISMTCYGVRKNVVRSLVLHVVPVVPTWNTTWKRIAWRAGVRIDATHWRRRRRSAEGASPSARRRRALRPRPRAAARTAFGLIRGKRTVHHPGCGAARGCAITTPPPRRRCCTGVRLHGNERALYFTCGAVASVHTWGRDVCF
jgi:hypothetical protein